MTVSNLDVVLHHLRRMVNPLNVAESDTCLLAQFLASRDEAAFAALLKRHGPMVFGVCRRLLNRVQDAEDVVQATFLLLARKAATIRKRASLGCWLHGVAHRLSVKLMRQEMKRQQREKQTSAMRKEADSPNYGGQEIQELLDTALQELPEKYRAALIFCCLEGKSQEEAAGLLGCPLGTVQSRLSRGRRLLQKRLAGKGLALSAGGLATYLTAQTATAALPAKLFSSALNAAIQYASGKALSALVPPSIVILVNWGLKSAALTKLLWICVGVLGLGMLAGSAGLAARNIETGTSGSPAAKQEPKAEPTELATQKPSQDLLGDPLPAGAVARLGTVRFNHGDGLSSLHYSPDGRTIVSYGGGMVRLWDADTGQEKRHFPVVYRGSTFSEDQTALLRDHLTRRGSARTFAPEVVQMLI